MRTKWSEKTSTEKTLLVLRIVVSLVVIAFAALQLSGVWDGAINYAVPLAGVQLLVTSIQEWKQNRVSSIVGFVCAVFVFTCAIVVFFVK